jgi:hypothetical protein
MSGRGFLFVVVNAVNQSGQLRNVTKNNRQNKRHGSEVASSREAASRRRPESGNSADSRRGQNAISIFILFHVIAITCWALPWNVPVIRNVKRIVLPYLRWSGLFQSWDMFAPNPESVNSYIKAVVITHDHHMRVWTFPRMEELSLWERYRKERYRKFTDVLPAQENQALWPDVANHIARAFARRGDSPDKVLLIQFRSDIKPGNDNAEPQPNVFYEEYIEPGDLR